MRCQSPSSVANGRARALLLKKTSEPRSTSVIASVWRTMKCVGRQRSPSSFDGIGLAGDRQGAGAIEHRFALSMPTPNERAFKEIHFPVSAG